MLSSPRNVLSKALQIANASWINRAIVAGVVPVVIVGAYTLTTGNTLVFEVSGTALTLYFVILVMLKTNFEVRAATKEHVEALRKSSQEQIETMKEEFGGLLAALQNVVKELSRLMPPATGSAKPGEEEKSVEAAKPEGTLLSRPPEETTKFLLSETLRQGAELFDSKDSLDTRASYMLALLGIILTIFSTAFITYWTSAAPSQLFLIWPTAYWLSLSLTLVIEFVILVVATSLGLDSTLHAWVSLLVVAVAVVLVAVAILTSLATIRGNRNLSRFQDERLREFRDLLAKMQSGTK